jgi:hypothetical protein
MQRVARRHGLDQLGRGGGKILHVAPVDGFEKGLSAGEVAIQRGNANAGTPRDLFQIDARSQLGKHRLRRRQKLLAITPGVCPHTPRRVLRFIHRAHVIGLFQISI